jgi:cephalosporin-C deacetylase-like acetyl esterase
LAYGAHLPFSSATAPGYAGQYPDMLVSHVAGRLNALASQWDVKRSALRTPADIEERNRFVREKFREMIHGYPERTPLQPVTVATHQRDGYRVENVMFQSRPDFWVTGNLYLPPGNGPQPGVISPCGHYPLSRMEPEYQSVYIDLVKAGFVVLAYDPIGQGERRRYWDPKTGRTEIATASTYEHSMPGQALLLMGEDLTHYRVWDGMRAIDYLEGRPEVDRQRIACAGHSGGGTLTLFISALDERVKCAVVNEGGTAHRWPIQAGPDARLGPADVEQNFFPAAKWGIDLCDLHVAIAPRPLLALIEEYSPRFNAASEHIRARYVQLGVAEKFGTDEAADPHSWTPKLRIAATRWLSRWLLDRPGPESEPEFPLEKPETLYCTSNGSLRYSGKGEDVFDVIRRKGAQLPPRRELSPKQVAEAARGLLRFHPAQGALEPRLRARTQRKGYAIEKIDFLSEPGIYIPSWVFIPEGEARPRPARLVFNEAGIQADGMEFGLYERLARAGTMVIACDVRGIGETKPPHSSSNNRAGEYAHLFDVETAITYMTWYLDESLFGMRVQDVCRSVDFALSRADVDPARFRVAGKGAGALWVLFAALLDPRLADIVCERGLVSYASLTRVDRYSHGAGIFVRDILQHFDLPQVAASLSDRKVTLVSPVGPGKGPVPLGQARAEYAAAFDAFQKAGRVEGFQIVEKVEL